MTKLYYIGRFIDTIKLLYNANGDIELKIFIGLLYIFNLYSIYCAYRQDYIFPFYQSYDLYCVPNENNLLSKLLLKSHFGYYITFCIPPDIYEFEVLNNKLYIKN